MHVSVTFLGLQRALARTERIRIRLSKEMRVADVLDYLKECYPELPFPEDALLVAVNNRISSLERILKEDDNVAFLPFLGGG
ncbi:MAG: MoaD/ThiS family protein [Deltaproteobacteria bacterium]|nr:MAG: MoaD/ThiS family protein [Deltaproteobacteria bacterium]